MIIDQLLYIIAMHAEDTEQDKNIKTVGPNLYVALAAVHFKSHTSSGSANKPDLRQLREIVYVLIFNALNSWYNAIICT